ncbi:hypothetical protein PCAR4_350175 [Paraburkholderia caribensis]|nr:hypothetical protein PCAR4_350175 [Paraburkholderia caribensis]
MVRRRIVSARRRPGSTTISPSLWKPTSSYGCSPGSPGGKGLAVLVGHFGSQPGSRTFAVPEWRGTLSTDLQRPSSAVLNVPQHGGA